MTVFETQACGRCGGSGHYSYNQIHGTTCYGCGGSGITLTKRGKAAKEFYAGLRMAPAHTLSVGDVVLDRIFSIGGNSSKQVKFRIAKIETGPAKALGYGYCIGREEAPQTAIHLERTSSRATEKTQIRIGSPAELYNRCPAPAMNDCLIELALAYQASLTDSAKPRRIAKCKCL